MHLKIGWPLSVCLNDVAFYENQDDRRTPRGPTQSKGQQRKDVRDLLNSPVSKQVETTFDHSLYY